MISFDSIRIDSITSLYKFHTIVDVLRLDLAHPVISGNKWFKLQGYFDEALALGKKTILTFGGAYSNHIVATAAAAKQLNLYSIGIIRGEQPKSLSQTLINAQEYEMELFYISREAYSRKEIPELVFEKFPSKEIYIINEGGYGVNGLKGFEQLYKDHHFSKYTHILVAVGTGTTLAGLTAVAQDHQQIMGISVLKNNFSLQQEIEQLLPPGKHNRFTLLHDYHFGGYAKVKGELFHFMNDFYSTTFIPTDFVYTGKLFFAVFDLLKKDYFPAGSSLLIIHSGGLQGNHSLRNGTLIF